ncbi:hypothetical protein DLJ53_18150 [Acuticoccus sediminis]|uniref:DUF1376 domain-containing protein n=1 Tax=Acuticoccus sediminis TaxID=2184697 RepID=A0A8B2NSW5_9HYPH|nr:hypothetical protein DLJ53_18150 [Acuticoccus sediminis]
MAELPAMPLFTDAYLGDTGHLTTIEHGAYLLLLMTMWRQGGSLTSDDKKLARIARMTPGQWARVRDTIMEFFHDEDGEIRQGRLTDTLNAVRQKSKSQSENARAKWRKNKASAYATAEPSQCQPDASKTKTKSSSSTKRKKEGADAPPFSDFWERSRETWKTLNAPAGGKAEAENAWKKLSNRERWVAFLVLDFYAASIRAQRTATFALNPKHVCRYLSHRLFREWEDQCTDDDDEAEERSADGRHDSVEHHATSPEPARREAGGDDHLGGLFPDGPPVHRADGRGDHAGRGDPVAATSDGGLAEVHHLDRWRRERQMPPDYRGADVPRRAAVAGELPDAMAGPIHGQPPRQSRFH